MEELPFFKMSLRLRLTLWAHEHALSLLVLSVFAVLVVWGS